jgi:hypothetical protein
MVTEDLVCFLAVVQHFLIQAGVVLRQGYVPVLRKSNTNFPFTMYFLGLTTLSYVVYDYTTTERMKL